MCAVFLLVSTPSLRPCRLPFGQGREGWEGLEGPLGAGEGDGLGRGEEGRGASTPVWQPTTFSLDFFPLLLPPLFCYHIPPSVWLSWILKLTLVPVVVAVVVVVFLWLRLSHSQSFVAPLSLLSSSTAPPPLILSLPHSLLSVNVGSLPSRFPLHVCEHVRKHLCVVGILTVVYPGASG